MKAWINAVGKLTILPESTTEAYALQAWRAKAEFEEVRIDLPPGGRRIIHAHHIVIEPYELTIRERESLNQFPSEAK